MPLYDTFLIDLHTTLGDYLSPPLGSLTLQDLGLTAASALQTHYVYTITCLDTGRVYVGTRVDCSRRLRRHQSRPPSRMRIDCKLFQPWDEHFHFSAIHCCRSALLAHRCKRHLISMKRTTASHGYNSIAGTPYRCKKYKKYWYLR